MKQLLKQFILAGVALVAISCDKEPLSEGYEGAVSFDITMSAETRAVNASDFTPEAIKVRIYREDGALIRRYTAMEEIPELLYLVAGNYSVKVEGGNPDNRAFVEPADPIERKQKLCYLGEKPFTVAAHSQSSIAVNCPTINVKAGVVFDAEDTERDETGRLKYENRYLSEVKMTLAALTTEATTVTELKAAINEAKAPSLTFDATGTGYFLMPEGVTTLVWSFEATHETDGAVAQVGRIANVTPGKGYAVNFHYSRTPDGFGGVTVLVDDSVESVEDDFNFKPQPEISGAGINAEGDNLYLKGESVVLNCESINDLVTLTLGGVAFFENGAVVEGAIEGVSATRLTATKVQFTLSSSYFGSLSGASQKLLFGMVDAEGSYEQTLSFRMRGLNVGEERYDLWKNIATVTAFVPEQGVQSVVVRYRRADSSVWNEFTATQSDASNWTATTASVWPTAVANRNGHSIYKPDTERGIYADVAYEFALVVDGEEDERVVLTPKSNQTIPYATFEDSSLACFGQDTGVAPYWGSGNNSYTTSDPLCRFSTFAGMQGNGCARLSSCEAGLMGINMLAAGNLFTGTFYRPSTTGTVSFGVKQNWTARPTSLRLKTWWQLGTVDCDNKNAGLIADGEPDVASALVAIVDWSSRHGVSSGLSSPTGMWSPEDGADAVSEGKIIGYGVAYPTGTASHDGMLEYEIPIVYYDPVTKPSSNYTLVISFATSRYGDYMNGSSNSDMYVDDLSWGYDGEFVRTFAQTTY